MTRLIHARRLFAAFAILTAPACADLPLDEVADLEQELHGDGAHAIDDGSPFALATVRIGAPATWTSDPDDGVGCTGVLVGRYHVLTAAHCKFNIVMPVSAITVSFYNGAYPTGDTSTVTRVDIRPGVIINGTNNPGIGNNDLMDSNGKFADVAVLTLASPAPSYTRVALLPFAYPGNNAVGYLVGTGAHFGLPNPFGMMMWLQDSTYSSDVNDGHFLLNTSDVDPGDSGGPFFKYDNLGRLFAHGDLFGYMPEWAAHAKYTSFSFHLAWILEKIGYTGGMLTYVDKFRSGTVYQILQIGDWRRCALVCDQASACKAYNHGGGQCSLLSSTGTLAAVPGYTTGSKWSL